MVLSSIVFGTEMLIILLKTTINIFYLLIDVQFKNPKPFFIQWQNTKSNKKIANGRIPCF